MFIPSIVLLFACSQDFEDTDKPQITYTRDTGTDDTASDGETDTPLDTGDPVDTDTNDTVDTGVGLSILENLVDTDDTEDSDTEETDTEETDTRGDRHRHWRY